MSRPAESLAEKIARVTAERVEVVDYDPAWPAMFEAEKRRLIECLPEGLIRRIEHFGSTAVPDLAAKPIVDILMEVRSVDEARERATPILEARGYDAFWRPTSGDDSPPWYPWFIRRDADGRRTHHIHMVEADFPHWERLAFRDHLIAHPDTAAEYAALKRRLSAEFPDDRVGYTAAKSDFIRRVTRRTLRRRDKRSMP